MSDKFRDQEDSSDGEKFQGDVQKCRERLRDLVFIHGPDPKSSTMAHWREEMHTPPTKFDDPLPTPTDFVISLRMSYFHSGLIQSPIDTRPVDKFGERDG